MNGQVQPLKQINIPASFQIPELVNQEGTLLKQNGNKGNSN
ncbi:unnamed protein product [Paramecium octaurelia]|uniref:Uncharacterized protein n=1 Tax=Paramecium octaurelia TaxID=43137 RepID=A0A8S1WQU2_PAROT|nr:unnamed protein product [Paramecium octaurelia]